MDDKKIIEFYGGPAKLARLLGFEGHNGTRRVFHWIKRGIPDAEKHRHRDILVTPFETIKENRRVSGERRRGPQRIGERRSGLDRRKKCIHEVV